MLSKSLFILNLNIILLSYSYEIIFINKNTFIQNSDLDILNNKVDFNTVSKFRVATNLSTSTINLRAYINDNDYIQLRTSGIFIVLEKVVSGVTTEIWAK